MRMGRWAPLAALVTVAVAVLPVANAQTLTNVTPLINGCKGTSGTGTCSVCQGFCTVDTDCAGHLRCFHRNLLTPIPGCTCTSTDCGSVDWDYCYDPGYGWTGGWNPPWTQPAWNANLNWNPNWNPPWTQPAWNANYNWNPPWNNAPTPPTHWAPTPPTHWAPTPPTHWAPTPPTHWASTPNHQPTPATSSKRLYSTNAAGCGSKGCVQCEGDCDTDADCEGNLTCFKRDGLESVPGCGSGGLEAWDYCVSNSGVTKETRMPTKRPATGPAPAPSPLIKNIGKNGCKDGSCRLCEGDCDSDADCGGGLRCFLRDNLEAVPGCTGSGHGAWDYCIANP